MSHLYARTAEEARLYMELHSCSCGESAFEAHSAVVQEQGVLLSRYTGRCPRCGARREFLFELPEQIRAIALDGLDFGGSDPSRLLDAGEWLAVSDRYAKRVPRTPGDLSIAIAALEEVLKFIPEGADRAPAGAFRSAQGRAVRDAEPGRFRRARLEAAGEVYRELRGGGVSAARTARLPEQPEASVASAAAAVSSASALEAAPLPALIEAFAHTVLAQQGLEGMELEHYRGELQSEVQSLVTRFQLKMVEQRQRRKSGGQVDQLLDGIAATGTAAGELVAAHRDAIAEAFRGVELARMSEGLGVLSAWLRSSSSGKSGKENEGKEQLIRELLDRLYAAMGVPAGGAAAGRGEPPR